MNKVKDAVDKVKSSTDQMSTSAKKANDEVTKFDRSAQKTQKSLLSWAKEKYSVLLEAKDKISPILSTIKGGLTSFGRKTWSVTMKAVDLATAPIRGVINLLKNPILQVGAVLGVSIGLKDTIDTCKDFEAAMSQVKAVSGATGSEFDKLTAKAKEMGKTTKFTATQSAEAFNYMAMAGWDSQQMLDGIEGILNLAAASGEDLGTTSDIVTDALTAFGLKASDAAHFSDVLAQSAASANTNVSMMGESFKYVAPIAGAMKYSVEDTSLALGLMANASVKGSMAGTSLKTALANMAAPTDKMATAMKKYGISLTDSNRNMKTLKGVLDNLRSSLGRLSETEKIAAASTIFGKEAMSGMLAIINATESDYNKLAESINNADGAASKMSDTMLDNLEGSITLLQSAMDGVKISFGERLSPYVRGIADWLTEQMPEVEQGLNEMMDWVDSKVDRMKRKFKELSQSDEWKNADFFGKVKLAWDDFIAEPFSEWWHSTGKQKIADIAGDMGTSIGTGLKLGILTLLGVDVSDTLNEGASVGASFAKGFAEGFDTDAIASKLFEGFGNMVKSAGKLLPGGESADLSSIFSAIMLAKIAGPVASLGKGAFSVGKAIFGKDAATGTSLAGSIGSSIIGSAAKGTGLKGLGVTMGMIGNTLGSGATTGAGLIAAGTAGTAGGVAAGATLVSAGIDAYKALKSDDKAEKSAYGESAAWKAGGVAAGAAVGAASGSIIPGLGTAVGALVGAGVGGIAGWIKGNKVKKEYQDNVEEVMAEYGPISNEAYESIVEQYKEAMNSSFESADFSSIGTTLSTKMSDSILNTDTSAFSTAFAELGTKSGTDAATAFQTADYSGVGAAVGSGISSAITNADMAQINSAVDALKSNTDSSVNSAFGAGVSTTMPVSVTLDYSLVNPTKTFTIGGGGSGSTTLTVSAHASGGYVNDKQLSWVGEEGPEAIIPLVPGRRNRALELYKEVGDILGVQANANGNIIGEATPLGGGSGSTTIGSTATEMFAYSSISDFLSLNDNLLAEAIRNGATGYNGFTEGTESDSDIADEPLSSSSTVETGKTNINLNIQMSPQFNISDSGTGKMDEASIMAIIRKNMKSMADELGGEIADRLEQVFSNMPVVKEG
jgi:TP901 family phage tail tape measure protein